MTNAFVRGAAPGSEKNVMCIGKNRKSNFTFLSLKKGKKQEKRKDIIEFLRV